MVWNLKEKRELSYLARKTLPFLCSLFLIWIFAFLPSHPAFAAYTANITTGGDINLNPLPGEVDVDANPITVTTNCTAGYNLFLSTTTNSTLYLDGNSASADPGFEAINNAYSLDDSSHNSNKWGYSMTGSSSTVGSFNPLSTTPVYIKTTQETATEDPSITDSFSVYYGANADSNAKEGLYYMTNDGGINYYLTTSPSCVDTAVVTFNENLDGEGSEGTDSSLTNFPTTEDNTIDTTNNTITLSTKRPTRSGYIFQEWNTEPDGTGDYYQVGETVPMGAGGLSGFVTLYAIWIEDCPARTICYIGNHQDGGSMDNQPATSNANNTLIPSNFNREGYGFAGWNTLADGTGTNYGPGQTINPGNITTKGLTLFANWIKATTTLQAWAGADNMAEGDVIALKDIRDNNAYAVAKLADGNVWMIENLRLVPNSVNFTSINTNNPTTDFINSAPSSSSTINQCNSDNDGCDNQIYYSAANLDRSATQSYNTNTNNDAWYSYGVMYNWYTATAGNGTYDFTSTSGPNGDGTTAGDICPSGWHLPTGGNNGEYTNLTAIMGGNSSTGSSNLRKYPNNFIYSGDYNPNDGVPTGRGIQGRLWQATAVSNANAYRMGYNSSTVTPTNSYNKWDNFAVRCIYQGGNIPFSNVTVSFPNSGTPDTSSVTSVTFVSNDYGTVTATPSSPTVSLADNSSYTITASMAARYEFSSWATTSAGTLGNATANPTTFTITDDTTLSINASEIPNYEVSVILGEHVDEISIRNTDYGTETLTPSSPTCIGGNNTYTCTINLYRGVIYELSSSFEEGYTIHEWTTTANGTLGDSTEISTTYVVTGTATLSLSAEEADEKTYNLVYDAGNGTDAPDSETKTSYNPSETFTVTNSAPIYYGYTFEGWAETPDATTATHFSGDTITVHGRNPSNTKILYAVYTANSCPAGKICYYDNGADVNNGGRGTMNNQTASSNTDVNLIPSNYSKSGYGFAGWTTDANATPYGPNASITTPDLSSSGLALYAKWVKSSGDLQTWSSCSSLAQNSVIALTDTRDNNTYAVAKLADGKCWFMENLRIDPGTANITTDNTNNPTSTFITQSEAGSGASLSTKTLCNTNDSTCFDQIQYNSNSTNRSLPQSHTTNSNSAAWYSYGTYFNWYTATAGNGIYDTSGNTSVTGDICPKNWRLPTGNTSGEANALNTAINNGGTNSDVGLRAYPANFVWSGDYNNTFRKSSYENGRIWTATAKDNNTSYRIGYAATTVTARNNTFNKWDGFVVRCVSSPSSANNSSNGIETASYIPTDIVEPSAAPQPTQANASTPIPNTSEPETSEKEEISDNANSDKLTVHEPASEQATIDPDPALAATAGTLAGASYAAAAYYFGKEKETE